MEFPQWVVDRVMARQGCLHPYDTLPAERLAVVVIDLQNYYMSPGYQGETPPARATVPAVNRLCDAVRGAGGTVVWVQTASDGADVFWSHHHGVMLTPERSARRLAELRRDSPGFSLYPELRPHDADPRVVKRCYSALAPGSSDLEQVLRRRGVDTLLIAGTVTNVCCESTARDAMMMDFRTIMVEDALSAMTPHEHEHALINWVLFFGDVLPVAEVESRLRPAAARRTA